MENVSAEPHIGTGEKVVELRAGTRPDDRSSHARMGEREVGQRNTTLLRERPQLIDEIELAPDLGPLEIPPLLRHETPSRTRARGGHCITRVLTGQPPSVERAVHDRADAMALARGQHARSI